MSVVETASSPMPSDIELQLSSVRSRSRKAEIALAAGRDYLKKYSVGLNLEDLYRAGSYFRQAQSFCAASPTSQTALMSAVLLARIDTIESRHEQAYDALLALEVDVLSLDDAETTASWLFTMALLYYYLRDYSRAYSHMLGALERYADLGMHHEHLLCQYNCGVYLVEVANYRQAFRHFSFALELSLQLNSPFMEYCYMHVAKLRLRNGEDPQSCRMYIDKAIELYKAKRDHGGIVFAYTSIAEYYLSVNDLDSALGWLELSRCQPSESWSTNVYYLRVNTDVLVRQRRFEEALLQYEQLIAISSIRNDAAYLTLAYRGIAEVLIEMGQYDRAEELLKECLSQYEPEYEDAKELCEIYRLLSLVSERTRKVTDAFDYYKHYHEWSAKSAEQQRHYDDEHAKHRLDMEVAAREREELKAKALELQRALDNKRAELTALAMELAQKNQQISSLKKNIKQLNTKDGDDSSTGADYASVVYEIDSLRQSGEEHWTNLQRQFESIDPQFLQRLLKHHSSLSPIELKICLLMRLNLSTKDIAQTLWISKRTVETHRYQIRKKMQLNTEENLFIALSSL